MRTFWNDYTIMDKDKWKYNAPFVPHDDASSPIENPLEVMAALEEVCRGKVPDAKRDALKAIRERLEANNHKNSKYWKKE